MTRFYDDVATATKRLPVRHQRQAGRLRDAVIAALLDSDDVAWLSVHVTSLSGHSYSIRLSPAKAKESDRVA